MFQNFWIVHAFMGRRYRKKKKSQRDPNGPRWLLS
jgi:hypothetical protein